MSNRIVHFFSIPVVSLLIIVMLILLLSPSTHAQNEVAGNTIPDVSVSTGVSSATVRNGDQVTFTVEVKNAGAAIATNVIVTEFLPLPYVQLLACQTDAPGGCVTDGFSQIIKFPSIATNQTKLISLVAQVGSDYLHGTKTNHRVFVSSDSDDSNDLNNKSISVIELLYPVDLELSQVVDIPAEALPGEVVTLTLDVKNVDSNPLYLIQQHGFENSDQIVISDTTFGNLQPALTYPSMITVEGITQPVVNVEVSIYAISRTWTEDIDMLLVSPSGISVTLLSDVGGATDLGGVDLKFSDSAENDATTQDMIPAGDYRPTNFAREDESWVDVYPSPGPGDVYDPVPYLGRLNGTDPNGVWQLYIVDDQPRDEGVMRFGWGITFTELVTNNIPIQLEHNAPELSLVGDISAPGWTVTKTASGFLASILVDAQTLLQPIVLHATTPLTPGVFPVTTSVDALFGEVNLENNVVGTFLANDALSDLALTGDVEPEGALYGETVTYTFVIVNYGPTTALDSVLKVQVADELSVITATTTMGTCAISGAKVTCNSGILRSIESSDVMTVTVVADTPGGGVPGPVLIITTALLENDKDPITENNSLQLESTIAEFARESVYLPLINR